MRNIYDAPMLIDIDVTNRCNLKCSYCNASSGESQERLEELSLIDFKNLFDEIESMNIHRISLAGGEPFIRKDFVSILELASQYSFSTIVNTNGLCITEKIALELKQINFDRICVTLDGSNETIHEGARGAKTFRKVVESIKLLQKHDIPVSTLFTLGSHNMDNLIETIRLNEELGVESMTCMVVCQTGRASDGNFSLDKDAWYPLFLKLSEMKRNNKIKLNFKIIPPNESSVFWLYYFPLKHYGRLDLLKYWDQNIPEDNESVPREISCKAGVLACAIAYNGDVYGCNLMLGINEFKAGNIKRRKFKDIWQDKNSFKELRNMRISDLVGHCRECDMNWCGGGCRSSAFNITNDIYGDDKSCYSFC